jgi:hypothetical protein
MGAIRFCNTISCWVQPPDAENRMSGGVGGITGAIPLSPPDQNYHHEGLEVLFLRVFVVKNILFLTIHNIDLIT